MDVDEDPDVLAKTMRNQLTALEVERKQALAQNKDTSFIDMQIEELRDFMESLEKGLEEALGKGTKRDRAEAEKMGDTGATAKQMVSRMGKAFKDWIKENKEY